VADLRAPTPSAAAELVVPDSSELADRIAGLKQRLRDSHERFIAEQRAYIIDLRERLKDPRRLQVNLQIHLDDLRERIQGAWRRERKTLGNKVQYLFSGLQHQNPVKQINEKEILLQGMRKDMRNHYNHYLMVLAEHLQRDAAVLNSLNPLNVLQRGYSVTRSQADGAIIRDAAALRAEEAVSVQLARGSFQAKVEKIFQE
jgi:exodeoxyribonuclease VII large subunit